MRLLQSDSLSQVLNVLRRIMDGPQMLAFLPAAVLAAFWLGGEGWLLAVALGALLGTQLGIHKWPAHRLRKGLAVVLAIAAGKLLFA